MTDVYGYVIKMLGILTLRKSKKGTGSFLTFDLYASSNTSDVSDLHIWVYLCNWSLFKGDELVLCSNDESEDKYAIVLEKMNSSLLEDISESAPGEEVRIKFNNGYQLRLTADLDNYDTDDDLIIIYTKGKTISYSPLKGFYEEAQ